MMGPHDSNIWSESFAAGEDLRTKQFYAVKLSAENTVIVPTAAADKAIGILQNNPNTGAAATVRLLGLSKAVCDGTTDIAVGDYVGTGAAGKLIKKATADFGVLGTLFTAVTEDAQVGTVALGLGTLFFRTAAG